MDCSLKLPIEAVTMNSPYRLSLYTVNINCPWSLHINSPNSLSIYIVHINCPYRLSVKAVNINCPYKQLIWIVNINCQYRLSIQIIHPDWGCAEIFIYIYIYIYIYAKTASTWWWCPGGCCCLGGAWGWPSLAHQATCNEGLTGGAIWQARHPTEHGLRNERTCFCCWGPYWCCICFMPVLSRLSLDGLTLTPCCRAGLCLCNCPYSRCIWTVHIASPYRLSVQAAHVPYP